MQKCVTSQSRADPRVLAGKFSQRVQHHFQHSPHVVTLRVNCTKGTGPCTSDAKGREREKKRMRKRSQKKLLFCVNASAKRNVKAKISLEFYRHSVKISY